MRISPDQLDTITRCIRHWLGDEAQVWLFGSRLDDAKRGGDVDLYVETLPHDIMNDMACKAELQDVLDLPVDLIVRSVDDDSPIATIAKSSGIRL